MPDCSVRQIGFTLGPTGNETHPKENSMNRLLALLAFATLTVFLGILAVKVPSLDLVAVIVLTVILVAYDFLTSSGKNSD